MKYKIKTYQADSGRGTGKEKVFCALVTSPNEILEKKNNLILDALAQSKLSTAIGLYFYRFSQPNSRFIKIGECTRTDGISIRFKRGWHGTEKYADTYLKRKNGAEYIDSKFFLEISKASQENPIYFIFYEHCTLNSHPKIDEIYAFQKHQRLFKGDTLSPERINGNGLLARNLVWHKKAFYEVARGVFPDGSCYPV